MESKKLLFYGGSFDPPHLGHRRLLEAAVGELHPDIVYVIPSGISPHKKRSVTPFWDRVNMCRISFRGIVNTKVLTVEGRGSKSYTFKTVRYLKKRYPGYELYMLIGSDMLESFKKWFLYRRIMASVSIVAGCRDDDDEADLRTSAEELIKEGARIVLLSFSPIETSSSELRISDPVKSADSGLISNEVADYIIKRGLYSK